MGPDHLVPVHREGVVDGVVKTQLFFQKEKIRSNRLPGIRMRVLTARLNLLKTILHMDDG